MNCLTTYQTLFWSARSPDPSPIEKWLINEYQACLDTYTGVSLQSDHLMGTSAHAPQRPMATYTEMGTVGPGPHGLLRH
ncbi:hypothetical protein TNCV_2492221 [Trichonephila clavipes]|nr:hypothetical protein TNCV_2492221 [Trichonephila clavipes]